MQIALIGNQNSGKTTLFNQITGSNQHVGNFPGVTVEHKSGQYKYDKEISVTDLPGIYSFSPYTPEEVVSRDFILESHPDVVIDVVDATNIERNLYLTLQIMELGVPIVIALNMMDEIRDNGGSINIDILSDELGIAVVPVSAIKNEGVRDLMDAAKEAAISRKLPKLDFCRGPVHDAIHAIVHLITEQVKRTDYTLRFAATCLVEGDDIVAEKLGLSDQDKKIIENIVIDMETHAGTDREAAIADMRYSFIEDLCTRAVKKPGRTKGSVISGRADRILTGKYTGIPIFFGLMFLIFYITFGPLGTWLSDSFTGLIDKGIGYISAMLKANSVSPWFSSLVEKGICEGVGSVLSFMPVVLLLFFFLSMLEDSGYMARVAFMMDNLLRKLGLSGRSIVPMLIGFGCTVPAVMSTRTLASERDRKFTMMLIPFMSCSAKLPIYAAFVQVLFPGKGALVMIGLYLFGIIMAIVSALILKKTAFSGNPIPFVMELPVYRVPSPKTILLNMWDKASDFLKRAFSVILLSSLAIWFLQSFDTHFNFTDDNTVSLLSYIGRAAAPLFTPLGFGDWRAASALIAGLSAKEVVISTLEVLTGSAGIGSIFTVRSAVSFLVFLLLYMPCIAAFSAYRSELIRTEKNASAGKTKAVLFMAYQTVLAWIISFIVTLVIKAV